MTTGKPKKITQGRARMQSLRDRRRAQGLRPVQFWVPDLRQPAVRDAIQREATALHRHPQNADIDDWIEAVADLDD